MKLQLFQNPKTEHDLLDFKWFITLISFDKLRRITFVWTLESARDVNIPKLIEAYIFTSWLLDIASKCCLLIMIYRVTNSRNFYGFISKLFAKHVLTKSPGPGLKKRAYDNSK